MSVRPSWDATFKLDTTNIRDLSPDVIDEAGLPRLMPASYYEGTTTNERALLGHRHGLYLLPTLELAKWLTEQIDDRVAIEIGAGNGRLAAHLEIPATDSMLQDEVSEFYEISGQPRSAFGPNVVKLEAQQAVRRYWPKVVVAAWVTHRWNRRYPGRGGNMFGPNLDWILGRVDEYVFIGNEQVHRFHPLPKLAQEIHHFPFVYSRAHNGSRDFVAVWRRS